MSIIIRIVTVCRFGFFLAALFTLFVSVESVNGSDQPVITGVEIAPDLSHISVRYSGDLGRHSAFVLPNPRRLVVDFEGARVARIPARIGIDRYPVKEVRIGHDNARARLVIDCGDDPVPAFSVERRKDRVVVVLGKQVSQSSLHLGKSPEDGISGPFLQKPSSSARSETNKQKAPSSNLLVKSAAMNGDLLVIELAPREKPGKAFRLVVDVDHESMKLRTASLSHQGETPRRYEMRELTSEEAMEFSSVSYASRGPRKNVNSDDPHNPPGLRTKFRWGNPPNSDSTTLPPTLGKIPFRMEKFKLSRESL